MRFRLRTLLILVIILPPLLAWAWFAFDKFRSREIDSAEWDGELSLIHGAGQSIEPGATTSDAPPE